jgi:hypothetical protein
MRELKNLVRNTQIAYSFSVNVLTKFYKKNVDQKCIYIGVKSLGRARDVPTDMPLGGELKSFGPLHFVPPPPRKIFFPEIRSTNKPGCNTVCEKFAALLVDPQQRYPVWVVDSDWSRLNVMDSDWLDLNINERWTLDF